MLVSRTNLHVLYFCKVALKRQKHLKGIFILSEYNYPMQSDLGVNFQDDLLLTTFEMTGLARHTGGNLKLYCSVFVAL